MKPKVAVGAGNESAPVQPVQTNSRRTNAWKHSEDTQTLGSHMRTKMNKLLLVPVVLGIISALGDTTTTPPTTTTTSEWTTGHSGLNLNGKMFTLSFNGGGISFYPSHYSPKKQHPTSTPYWTTTNPYTTASPYTRGVSVCVCYITDWSVQSFSFFTLSPSTTPLSLGASSSNSYWLSYGKYGSMTQSFRPNIWFFTDLGLDIWTRVCVTVDSMKNTTQMFVGPYMSIKKLLPGKYVWSGEPSDSIFRFRWSADQHPGVGLSSSLQ
ncbi:uncharacterized protein LOC113130417 [Mastacembelus armatus]|uniref:uncharacterized protein LOC113130417 n=1 Tax=Mastacembelus armatus TaxID=205130 RepID=UPI000E453F6D|nr:uncharacterized protein LOC113130417 [Mastacembelus armatus]